MIFKVYFEVYGKKLMKRVNFDAVIDLIPQANVEQLKLIK